MESEQSEGAKKINPKDAMTKSFWTALEDKFSRANLLDDDLYTSLEAYLKELTEMVDADSSFSRTSLKELIEILCLKCIKIKPHLLFKQV